MILIIAEKPSVKNNIKKALKINTEKRSREFEEGSGFILTNAIGHLTKQKMPNEINEKYSNWNVENLPFFFNVIPLVVEKNVSTQFNVVKKLLNDNRVSEIINACDPEREGELIYRNIVELAGHKKGVKTSRMWITSMTDAGIKEAFEKRLPLFNYDNLAMAAKARSYSDYFIGLNTTMGITNKLGELYSSGRVQTPVLKIITDREKEITNFISKNYYKLKADVKINQENYDFDYKNEDLENDSFEKKEDAEKTKNNIGIGEAKVIKVEKELKNENPKSLFNLSALQIEMNRTKGLSADETLKIAQTLYEKYGLITYPRSDETKVSGKFAEKSFQIIKNMPVFKEFTEKIVSNNWKLKRTFIADESKIGAHEAITPVIGRIKIDNIKQLNQNERDVFEAIYRRFISAFYPPAKIETQKITILRKDEQFQRSVRDIKELGYREVYLENLKDSKLIQNVSENDIVEIINIETTKHKTTPPTRFTEGELIRIMEKPYKYVEEKSEKDILKEVKGIGTEATRASIIQRLKAVEYITLKKQGKVAQIYPTEKGLKFIELVPSEKIKSVSLTANIEKGLSMIESGKVSYEKFMEGIKRVVNEMMTEIKTMKQEEKKTFEAETFRVKTYWNKESIDIEENKFVFQSVDKDKKIVIFKNTLEKALGYKKITKTQAKELLEKGKTSKKVKLKSKKKNTEYEAYLIYDNVKNNVWISFD